MTLQYFRPGGPYFVGDCMPFFHDGTFHLFYLLDENHHQALNGLGGHQWAHVTSKDLIHWEHHPLAIAISGAHEGSICTGSVFYHDGIYYGYYATRMLDWTQHLSLATSRDGIHFEKTTPNPFASPSAAYSPYHFRDPCLLRDAETGLFHLLVTAKLEPYVLPERGGCLAHLVSSDLQQWHEVEPLVIPGYSDVPECPDHFYWNGWYYLLFSNSLTARYRMARHPLGPWLTPPVDTLDGRLARVMKTAAFTGNRRIGVAWLGTRAGDKDDGKPQWGGHLLFRELIQQADGTLACRFPTEMVPPTGEALALAATPLTPGVTVDGKQVTLAQASGLAVAEFGPVPQNVRITLRVLPGSVSGLYGLRLRGSDQFAPGYDVQILPAERMVKLHEETIAAVEGLDQPFTVEIILQDDLIDLCVDDRRCIVNRCPERRGDRLFLFAQNTQVTFADLQVQPLGKTT